MIGNGHGFNEWEFRDKESKPLELFEPLRNRTDKITEKEIEELTNSFINNNFFDKLNKR